MRRLLGLFGGSADHPHAQIWTERLHLRLPRESDFDNWRAERSRSRDFLTPWEPVWPQDDLTASAFRRRVRRVREEANADLGYSFLIFSREGVLLGGISLSNLRRRAAQMATLGYWMGCAHAGRGIMTEAVVAVSLHGFDRLRLARIEAGCLPDNVASIRVLEKAGFLREGQARAYLEIAGSRRDHLLFARLASDPQPVIPACSLPQAGSALVV